MAEQKESAAQGATEFFKNLVRSFMPASYPQLAGRPASSSAAYLAGVLFLVMLLLTPLLYTEHESAVAMHRAYIEAAYPEDLAFENGEAVYDGEQPYVYDETVGDIRRALVVDTTGATTELPKEYDVGTLITKDKIIDTARPAEGPERKAEHPIPEIEGRVSARRVFLDALERNKWPQFLLGLGSSFFVSVLLLFIIAGVAMAITFGFEGFRKQDGLRAAVCFAIVAHAATPVAFIPASAPLAPSATWQYILIVVPFILFVTLLIGGAQACRTAQRASTGAAQTTPKKHQAK
ncbi:MAG: DUF1189 family protein [Verrucomicrobia bacterium]|nr:DUF1189 family protein [Verrucomicrobiota bacterium]